MAHSTSREVNWHCNTFPSCERKVTCQTYYCLTTRSACILHRSNRAQDCFTCFEHVPIDDLVQTNEREGFICPQRRDTANLSAHLPRLGKDSNTIRSNPYSSRTSKRHIGILTKTKHFEKPVSRLSNMGCNLSVPKNPKTSKPPSGRDQANETTPALSEVNKTLVKDKQNATSDPSKSDPMNHIQRPLEDSIFDGATASLGKPTSKTARDARVQAESNCYARSIRPVDEDSILGFGDAIEGVKETETGPDGVASTASFKPGRYYSINRVDS